MVMKFCPPLSAGLRPVTRTRALQVLLTLLLALGGAGDVQAALPVPLVDLRFDEPAGLAATNSGSLSGEGQFVQADALPAFTNVVPAGPFAPTGNRGSVDFGTIAAGEGGRAVDLVAGDNTLGALGAFTVAGWVNARNLSEGFGGNRLAFALESPNGAGFDLVQLANGALRIGINQWPDGANGGGPSSSAGRLKADPAAGASNWVFFAVTYDPALASGHLRYFFGTPAALATQDSAHDYRGGLDNGGAVDSSGQLTVGNFSAVVGARNELGPEGGSRVFRGLVDELRVYSAALSLEDVQRAQLNGEPPPTPVSITTQPAPQKVFAGATAAFSVQITGSAPYSFQWYRGTNAISDATNQTLSLPGVSLADNGASYRVAVSNLLGGVLSDPAGLTVVDDQGARVWLSFSEAAGTTTTNAGGAGGQAGFVVQNGRPIFSSNVPAGQFAPTGNVASADFGAIAAGDGGRAIDLVTEIGTGVGALPQFTISGWLNARELDEGFGGNRIAFALASPNGPGFDLVQTTAGALRIGVNQWPDGANGGGPLSSEGRIAADPETGAGNWVFFAVVYDSALGAGQLSYYFGSPTQTAELDLAADYLQGPITQSGPLTVGNFGTVVGARNEAGPGGGSRVFRGLVDELRIHSRALTLDEVRGVQTAPAYVAPAQPVIVVTPPADQTVFAGQAVQFDVAFTGTGPVTFQWLRNDSPVAGATNSSLRLAAASLADDQSRYAVAITNAAGGLVSTAARLTVLPENNVKVRLSFSEGTGTTTANTGNLGGSATLVVRPTGFPAFSTNAPIGAFAPPGNGLALDLGSIGDGEGGQAVDLVTAFGGTAGPYPAFTLAGWLNCRDLREGFGGNRVAFALASPGGPGFDLVQTAAGALRIGVNQWPDAGAGGPLSSEGRITEDAATGAANWVFFAVTYDPALPGGQLSYYFGSPSAAAALDVAADYAQGEILQSGPLTVGNFSTVVGARNELGPAGGSRVFRGLMDELTVLNKAATLTEIQALQIQAPPGPAVTLAYRREGAEIVLVWPASSPARLQSRGDLGAGSWADVPGTPVVAGDTQSVRQPITGAAQFYRLTAP